MSDGEMYRFAIARDELLLLPPATCYPSTVRWPQTMARPKSLQTKAWARTSPEATAAIGTVPGHQLVHMMYVR